NQKAKVLADCLDRANGKFLENDKSPSRKVNELDNRGSHFYLAMYWAQELAVQTEDQELSDTFKKLSNSLTEGENKIVAELNEAQGVAIEMGGYFHADLQKVASAMRPSKTLNSAIASLH
ncbi:MAG: NADP-dependent isocitrate dehydrogenase, partial [Bdellovibrionales bacterium]